MTHERTRCEPCIDQQVVGAEGQQGNIVHAKQQDGSRKICLISTDGLLVFLGFGLKASMPPAVNQFIKTYNSEDTSSDGLSNFRELSASR